MATKRKSLSKSKGPFEPGSTGGLSYLSGKTLDKCFVEVARAILFGLGNSRPDEPALKRDVLYSHACSAFQINAQHAQSLVQQVSSEVPEQALNIRVIKAENLAENANDLNTCAKLRIVNVRDLASEEDGPMDSTFEATRIQEADINPEYNEVFSFDLEEVDGKAVLLEIWAHPSAGKAETPRQEETGMFMRIFNRLTKQSSVEEGVLATLVIPLNQIHPTGETTWYTMRSKYNIDTRCQLTLSFVANKVSDLIDFPDVERSYGGDGGGGVDDVTMQYRLLARTFLDHQHLLAKKNGDNFVNTDSSWYQWTHETEEILARYCQQHGVSRLQQVALTVEAVAQMHRCQTLPSGMLLYFCQQLEEVFDSMESFSEAEMPVVKHTLDDVINFVLGRFSISSELFPPRTDQHLVEIQAFVNILHGLQKTKLWRTFLPGKTAADLSRQAKVAMQARIKAWYLASVEFSMGFCQELAGVVTITQKMNTVMSSFQVALTTANQSYFDIFASFDLNYSNLCLGHFHTLMMSDLDKFTRLARNTLEKSMAEGPSVSVKTRTLLTTSCLLLKKLFTQMVLLDKLAHQKGAADDDDDCDDTFVNVSGLIDSHVYFERLLPLWLKQLRLQAEDCVYSALAMEKLTVVAGSSKMLSSADTVISFLHELEIGWSEVCAWPDPVIAFLTSARVMDVMADVARLYIQRMTALVPSWHLRKDVSLSAQGRKLCLALRAMYSFLEVLAEPPSWINWQQVTEGLKSEAKMPSSVPLSSSLTSLSPLSSTASRLAKNLSAESSGAGGNSSVGPAVMSMAYSDARRLLRKAVSAIINELTLLNLPALIHQVLNTADNMESTAGDVYLPLHNWLRDFKSMLTDDPPLHPDLYGMVMQELWDCILNALISGLSGLKKGKSEICRKLYSSLLSSDGLLMVFVSLTAKVCHYNRDNFSTPTMDRIKHILQIEGCSSSELTAYHYKELLMYPVECGAGAHGQVQVVTQLQGKTLQLTVRNGKRLNNISGVCNSYVMVQFHPSGCFTSTSSARSQPVLKRTSPMYDFKVETTLTCSPLPDHSVAVVLVMHSRAPNDDDIMLGQAVLPLVTALATTVAATTTDKSQTQKQSQVDSRPVRTDLDILLCPSDIMEVNPHVTLHSLTALHRRVTSDITASTQSAVLDKTLEMAATTQSLLAS